MQLERRKQAKRHRSAQPIAGHCCRRGTFGHLSSLAPKSDGRYLAKGLLGGLTQPAGCRSCRQMRFLESTNQQASWYFLEVASLLSRLRNTLRTRGLPNTGQVKSRQHPPFAAQGSFDGVVGVYGPPSGTAMHSAHVVLRYHHL